MVMRSVCLLIFGLIAATSAQAFQFSPIFAQLTPSGAGSSTTFTATNPTGAPVAIELSVTTRMLDEKGNEHRSPEEENFLITPPQLVLMPNESQSIRVQWLGEPDLSQERAFRLLANQVSVSLEEEKEGANLSINYEYEVSLYVTPPKSAPDVKVERAVPLTDAVEPMLELVLHNHGNSRGMLEGPALKITGTDGKTVELNGEATSGLNGQNIYPGTKRIVLLPWPQAVPVGPVTVDLQTGYMGL